MNTDNLSLDELFTPYTQKQFDNQFPEPWNFIGSGSGAHVYRVKDKKDNVQKAIKIYNKNQISEENIGDLKRQIHNLKQLAGNSQYIVTLHQAIRVMKDKKPIKYCIVLDLCSCSLKTLLDAGGLSLRDKYEYCLRITKALNILHKHKIMHRDLKPDNILMKKNIDEKQYPIIIDFGHSKEITLNVEMSQIRGTPKYTNPNLNFKDYKYEWDIYSLGVVYYEIFSEGKFFFDMGGFGQIEKFISYLSSFLQEILPFLKGKQFLPEGMKDLIYSCLVSENANQNKTAQLVTTLQKMIQELDHCNISVTTNDETKKHFSDEIIIQNDDHKIFQSSKQVSQKIQDNKLYSSIKESKSSSHQKSQLPKKQKQMAFFDDKQTSQISKLISVMTKIEKRKQQCIMSTIVFGKLKEFQVKLKSFKIIEDQQKMQKDSKLFLLICALKHLLISIKQNKQNSEQNLNEYSKKHYSVFEQKIQKEYNDLYAQYKKKKYVLSQDRKKAVDHENTNSNQVVKVFKHCVQNEDKIKERQNILKLLD